MTVGNGAVAESVAKLGGQLGSPVLARKLFELIRPSALGFEPDKSIDAAADVVDTMAIAAEGSGWLW